MDVSRETGIRLDTLCAMVTRWNSTINLVAPSSIPMLAERHVADSQQLLVHAPAQPVHWVDLGSGGGFPGLVIAAHLADRAPACQVTLVEADRRKAVFLREASREMQLKINVIADRIENILGLYADVVSARALAPLSELLQMARRQLAPGGLCLFPKGRSAEQEINEAMAKGWRCEVQRHKSLTDAEGVILAIRLLPQPNAE